MAGLSSPRESGLGARYPMIVALRGLIFVVTRASEAYDTSVKDLRKKFRFAAPVGIQVVDPIRFSMRPPMKNMNKLMLWTIVLILFSGAGLHAQVQDITGTWQGTIKVPGRDLRTIIKISKADNGGLKAVMYSIDQGGQGIGATSITQEGPTVKMSVSSINGTYEGKLTPDGALIEGTWTQGTASFPLILDRATNDTAWVIPAPPKPMAADADPVFEVATIKPSNPDTPGIGIRVNARQFSTINTTLSDLVTFAYGLHPKQIEGGPDWFNKEKYDIMAKPDGEGQPNDKQWKTMLQKLLADRFQLTFHREKKDLPVYAFVIGKSGSKLTKSEGDPNGLPGLGFSKLGDLHARNANIPDLAGLMQLAVLDRPVVDQTGLSGRFDFELSWTPTEDQFTGMRGRMPPAPPATTDNPDAPPDLFTAVQEQLGLRLESTKAPVDVLVIDRVEKPSAN